METKLSRPNTPLGNELPIPGAGVFPPRRFLDRMRRWGGRFLPAETLFFLAIWLLLLAVGRERLFLDPGTFWHVVWGEQILQTGRVPRVDTFSFTRAGQPVVADQWLAEALMALVHRIAGWEGLLLLTATMLAGLYGWIGSRLVRAGVAPLWTGGILAMVFLASAHNFHVRPLVATLWFQAIWFSGLLAVEAGRIPIGRLWWFVPLSILWTNLHGGVLAGLGTLGLCVVLWTLQGWFAQQGPVRSVVQAGYGVAIFGICVLGILVNPYGMDLPKTWYATLSMNLGQWIQEHRPWRLSEPDGWATVVLLFGYGALLTLMFRQGSFRVGWTLPMMWFVLGMQRVRNLPLFAEMAALTIAELVAAGRHSRQGSADQTDLPSGSSCVGWGWQKYVIPIGLVIMAGVFQTAKWEIPLVGSRWVRFSAERWPVGLSEELQLASRQVPEGTPIFNDLNFGGWLIYFTPRWRVFIDDRCALYGEKFLAAYMEVCRHPPAQWDQWQREYGFRWALVYRDSPLDGYLAFQPGWRCRGRDQVAAFYQLQDP